MNISVFGILGTVALLVFGLWLFVLDYRAVEATPKQRLLRRTVGALAVLLCFYFLWAVV
jgi:hypothetical protein